MATVSKRNAYLVSLGWWLAKRKLRARANELMTDDQPTRRRGGRLRLVLLVGVVGLAAYVIMRQRGDRQHGWISYQPGDLNGKSSADVAATPVPTSPPQE